MKHPSSSSLQPSPFPTAEAGRCDHDLGRKERRRHDCESHVSRVSGAPAFCISEWDRKMLFSDFVQDGLRYLNREHENVIMLYEAPSTCVDDTTFHNSHKFRVHDYPPSPLYAKAVLDPCRYSLMNGSAYPAYLRGGAPPPGLLDHWAAAVPRFSAPRFAADIPPTAADGDEHRGTALVYAYLPCEEIERHANDPSVHHHLCGKDALPRMTSRTPRRLGSTGPACRPCVAKTTHSMGGKGIFVIRGDRDEGEFRQFLVDAGNPNYVVTELVDDIARNVACHFFLHPDGRRITFFGSNESYRVADRHSRSGPFGSDSHWVWSDQGVLKSMQLDLVREVAAYCRSLGFWGFCGIDVLFDSAGRGYLIDVNPRVTGSLPSIMVANLFRETRGFGYGILRRSGPICYPGPSRKLLEEVSRFNDAHRRDCQVVIFSLAELDSKRTMIHIGAYGTSLDKCRNAVNRFAKPEP